MKKLFMIHKVLIILLFISTSACAQNRPGPESKPNIIIFLADDMGNGDMSRNGTLYQTPNIDALAAGGAYFDRFYSYPACTPSRAALLTGRYPLRYGLWQVVIGKYDDYGLPQSEDEYLLPKLMKEAGYTTAMVGKWHLGHIYPEYLPHNRGFDYYFGTSYGLLDYYLWEFEHAKDVQENGRPVEPDGSYFTEKITEKCLEFLDRQQTNTPDKPFFLYVPYNAPHVGPYGTGADRIQIPEDSLALAPPYLTPIQKRYWVMMKILDDSVGEIWRKTRELGIEENTIIIFASDNGGDIDYAASNFPYRGEKGGLLEGGIRAPLIWYHKNTISPQVVSEPVHIEDLNPTLLIRAGSDISDIKGALDGEDIYPLITGGSIAPRTFMVYYQPINNLIDPSYAVIKGGFKLCNNCGEYQMELYKVDTDPGEMNNIAKSNPKLTAQLEHYANSFSGFVKSRTNHYATSPPPGWQPITRWAVPSTFYSPKYYYYRTPH